MRSLVLILALAIAFGAAATWQSRKVEALKSERARAEALANGEFAQTPSGEIPAGWAVVTIGRPVDPGGASGEVRDARAAAGSGLDSGSGHADNDEPRSAAFGPVDDASPLDISEPPIPMDDGQRVWELLVTEGQTLSAIAAAHYGSAATDLVAALARYNALASPGELRVGQRLELPPLDLLFGD